MGRPPLDINPDLVLGLARIHCTNREIATIVGCHVDTLTNRFSDLLEKGREEGRMSLRRLQWAKAEAGNVTMMIWLGKQMLGQKDVAQLQHELSHDSTLAAMQSEDYNFDDVPVEKLKEMEATLQTARQRRVVNAAEPIETQPLDPPLRLIRSDNGNGTHSTNGDGPDGR